MNRKSRLIVEASGLLLLSLLLVQLFQMGDGGANPDAKAQASAADLNILEPQKVQPGYTLYPESGSALVRLLDIKGHTIHSWNVDAERARLLPNGNLLVIHGSKWGRNREPWSELRETIREYSWNGRVVWEYKASDVAHHDLHRLENGNTVFLRRTVVPAEFKQNIDDQIRRATELRSDSVIEIDSNGRVVYEWHVHENLDLNYCGRRGCNYLLGKNSKKAADWTHINTIQLLPQNKWFQSGDARFRPGNFVILPRNWWTFLIIDRESGKPVWEYEGDYKGGLTGGHEAQMIEQGLPGAGNLLVFDNGSSRKPQQSIILEIDPTTNEIVWKYERPGEFFSVTRGSVQRLENGNTLISEDRTGRVFEVTTEGQKVWEYQGQHPTSRAYRYSIDYCPQFGDL